MPVSFKAFSGFIFFIMIFALSACSRDNPLSVPDEFINPDKLNCDVVIPNFGLLTNIELTETNLAPVYAIETFNYTAKVDYLQGLIHVLPVFRNTGDVINALLDPYEHIIELVNVDIKVNDNLFELGDSSVLINLTEPSSPSVIQQFTILEIQVKENYRVNQRLQEGDTCEVQKKKVTETVTNEDGVEENVEVTVNLTENIIITYIYTVQVERGLIGNQIFTDLTLPSSVNSAEDNFGSSVSLGELQSESTTNKILAVGVIGDDSSAIDTGAVYIYEQVKTSWNQSAKIIASNAESGDLFGYSVSLFGDFLAVSAPGEDSLSSGFFPLIDNEGAVDNDNQPIPDGVNDNALFEVSNLAPSSGAVYLFKYVQNSWLQVAYIKAPINQIGVDGYDNGFGLKVLLRDNVLLVSAPKEDSVNGQSNDSSKPNAGAVYVYTYSALSDEWAYTTTLKSSVVDANDSFGKALDMFNGVIIVGAPGEGSSANSSIVEVDIAVGDLRLDNSSPGSGAAYVFKQFGSNWLQTAYLKASNNDEGDAFGSSIAMTATEVFIGAIHEDGNGILLNRNKSDNSLPNSGAAYGFYVAEEEQWIEFVYIKSLLPKNNGQFASEIVVGNNNLIIGAANYFVEERNSLGVIDIYGQVGDDLTFVLGRFSEIDQVDARFGGALALYKGVLATGANGYTDRSSGVAKFHSGKVYVHQ